MPRHLSHNPPKNYLINSTPLDVTVGGTSSTSAAGALSNLNGISRDKIDNINGVASVTNGKVSNDIWIGLMTTPMIDGLKPVDVEQGSVNTYQITNFDSFCNYVVSTEFPGASVGVSGDTIIYTAPNYGGTHGFKINNKTISVVTKGVYLSRPTILTPVADAVDVNNYMPIIISDFKASATKDWLQTEIAILDHTRKTIHTYIIAPPLTIKNAVTVTLLEPSKTYYVRARYNGTDVGWSEWSPMVKFSTRANFGPVKLLRTIANPTPVIDDWFGYSVDMSINADVIVVGTPNKDDTISNIGDVVVYTKDQATDSYLAPVQLPKSNNLLVNSRYGWDVCIDNSGKTIAVSTPHHSVTAGTAIGSVRVMEIDTGGNWQTTLFREGLSDGMMFGNSVAISGNGKVLVVGSPGTTIGGVKSGVVYIYQRKPDLTWDTTALVLQPSTPLPQMMFGNDVAVSKDGSTIVTASHIKNIVYIFTKQGTGYIVTEVTPPTGIKVDGYGCSLAIDDIGVRIAVGAMLTDKDGKTDCGVLYVLDKRSNAVWDQTLVYPNDAVSTDYFGSSIDISGDGNNIVVSALVKVDSTASKGQCYLCSKEGDAWSVVHLDPPKTGDIRFGQSVSISPDGYTLAISGIFDDITAGTIIPDAGSINIYR